MSNFEYSGTELSIFERANNWKAYWAKQIIPYMGKSILEVGAGNGVNAKTLNAHNYESWKCIEPDFKLCQEIKNKIIGGDLPESLLVKAITSDKLESEEQFDTVLYIDVLEHIENDRVELEIVSRHLAKGGVIIVISPAHNFLYSAFDAKIGHFRRYNKEMLRRIIPEQMVVKEMRYLDSVGLFASLANRLILRSADPTHKQIQFWDRFMVKVSRLIDPLIGYRMGKSIFCILEKK